MPKPAEWPEQAPYYEAEPGGPIVVPVMRGSDGDDRWDTGPVTVQPSEVGYADHVAEIEHIEGVLRRPRTSSDDELDVIAASDHPDG